MDSTIFSDRIKKIPKIELHLHLEGAISLAHINDLLNRKAAKEKEDLNSLFSFNDFDGFLKSYVYILSLITEYDDFYRMTYELLTSLVKQNVIYTEIMFTPWFFVRKGLEYNKIMSKILAAISYFEAHKNIVVNLIFDGPRNFGKSVVHEVFELAVNDTSGKVVGIGLGGDEKNFPAHLFLDEFNFAKNNGLACTAHAGEGCGEQSIYDSINFLGVTRLGHAVGITAGSATEKKILEKKIVLDLCPTSNLFTGVIDDIQQHPIKEYLERGYLITVNSDDPTFFKTTLENELNLLSKYFNFSESELLRLQYNAVEGALISSQEKQKLITIIDRFL